MIENVAKFADYFNSVRRRTLHYARHIPADRLAWSPRAGEFTCAEILRHIGSAEKMFVGVAVHGIWKYEGHTGGPTSLAELITDLEEIQRVAMDTLRSLPDSALYQYRPPLEGNIPVHVWRWLMAMVEHEVHHRSQLAMYLMLGGITPPHIFGLGVDDLIARATG